MAYTIRIGKKVISIKPTENNLAPVDFAIGIFNDKAYLGYWQDFEMLDDLGDVVDVETLPVLVFEDKMVIYESSSLKEMGAKRSTKPAESENWWGGKIIEVDPANYYKEVYESFKYYVDLPEQHLHFLSLWTIGTIFHTLFDAYPYLHLFGIKRSGKTKTLTLIKCLGFNGIRSHSLTEATLYRLIEAGKATLLLDEQDYLTNPERRVEFRTLLLGGYKKGSFVYRSEKTSKGKIIPTRFQIYSCKALANIEGLESVLEDRTITITMQRSVDPNITRRDVDENDQKWITLRNKLASLFLKYWKEVQECYRNVLKALGDTPDLSETYGNLKLVKGASCQIYSRNREVWSPILALALFFEGKGINGLIEKVLEVAMENINEKQMDEAETPEVGLVYALKKSAYAGDGYYPLKTIFENFKEETGLEKVDPRSLGRMLKRLGFKDKIKRGGTMHYFISCNKIAEVAKRLNIVFEETGVLGKTTHTTKTTETPDDTLNKAYDWVKMQNFFSVGDLAAALGITSAEASKLLEILKNTKKVIEFGGRYILVEPKTV